MINITRWAGKHPLFVRFVLLPILFYLQGRLAFQAGADWFYDGLVLSQPWVWVMISVLWAAAFIYPTNAKEIMKTAYWRIKGLEWVACTAAFGLWFYAGNQMAQQFETTAVQQQVAKPTAVAAAAYYSEEGNVEVKKNKPTKNRRDYSERINTEETHKRENKITQAYRKYFNNAIKAIKGEHGKKAIPTALGVVLGIIGIGFGIVILVCGIQCGSTGGGIALGVIGGLALIGLGVWALIAGFRKTGVNQIR